VNAAAVRLRPLAANDLHALATFRCSAGEPWEELVEQQVRWPLPRRYLASPPRFDGRMLLACDPARAILAVGAHHIEPTMVPDVGYTEVVAVALEARGTRLPLPDGTEITLGAFMLLTIFRQMRELRRHPRTFARVDRRNTRGLALCDRVGLSEQHADSHDEMLVQRWGELPSS
jgi:hypothetical protein